jgi:hypothetical protein
MVVPCLVLGLEYFFLGSCRCENFVPRRRVDSGPFVVEVLRGDQFLVALDFGDESLVVEV